jgi:hypothetical protein
VILISDVFYDFYDVLSDETATYTNEPLFPMSKDRDVMTVLCYANHAGAFPASSDAKAIAPAQIVRLPRAMTSDS